MPVSPGLASLDLRPGHPDFLDLPWALPLKEWAGRCPRIVQLQRGLSRHEVLFVSYGAAVYALKELPRGNAEREYNLLLQLEDRDLPSVVAVGHAGVVHEDGEPGSVLVTRFLDASLPYRVLFQSKGLERYRERLLDAMAGLIVRLHLGGLYWGDCSLSNTLFRRDAGELRAYLVDAETSEMHDELSNGQREQDLLIMEENVEGELADLAALAELPHEMRRDDTGATIRRRYDALWGEIGRELMLGVDEGWRIQERVRALNALGFSVGEIELVKTGEGDRLRLRTIVTDRDYHRRQFHNLTGIVAGERQAELMLNDLQEFRVQLSARTGRSVPMAAAAYHWETERWQPVLARLTPLVEKGAEPAELYCQVLEHKWFLSEKARRDVGLEAAVTDYVERFRSA